jgi:RNA polymerase sigma-70 factor (ECF subfamily)
VLSDEELVAASLQGSHTAFGELVERYQQRLLRFLLSRSASRADAEDALQDTFLSAHRYLASFNARWRFSTWLYRIALRNMARQQRPAWQDSELDLPGGEDPLHACIIESERENVWLTAKTLLAEEAFNAMWLRYVEDMSVREVARALERSASWTKVTLFRSRKTLASALNEGTAASGGSRNE